MTGCAKNTRGIEWSLRTFTGICEHMRAVRLLFLRARAVINFLARAVSTLEITNGEQRGLRKFFASWNLPLLKRCFAPSNGHVQNRTTGAKLLNLLRSYRGSTIPSSLHSVMPCLICRLKQNYFTRVSGWTLNGI